LQKQSECFEETYLAGKEFCLSNGKEVGVVENVRVSPDEAIRMLKDGNARFVSDASEYPNSGSARRALTSSQGQHPFACILACADSRVPVELILDRGIGDVFVVRVAGNVLGLSERGSVEYAVDVLDAPLFVVLGHTKCGAVKAVFQEGLLGGNLRALSEKILPAVEEVKNNSGGRENLSHEAQLMDESARVNVWNTIEDALLSSEAIRKKVTSQECKVIGALYDIDSGLIDWMGPHPRQKQLLGV
jgi:carbonic anhydrase